MYNGGVCVNIYVYKYVSVCIQTYMPGPHHRPTKSESPVVILSENQVENQCHKSRSMMVPDVRDRPVFYIRTYGN